MKKLSESKCFGGRQLRYEHDSGATSCKMTFAIYLPPAAEQTKVPVLYWLSGLTCTDENFVTKAGAQRYAAEHGIAIVVPDTSPRGEDVPDDENAAYDFGLGAGFYVDATELPWIKHYQMYSYVSEELPGLINANFNVDGARQGIFGHSMGGHGAITIALKNADNYRSVSAFAPIGSPLNCPWGNKALSRYIGVDQSLWWQYDSCELLKRVSARIPLRVDQGLADPFLVEQLRPDLLEAAAAAVGYPLEIHYHEGYDHSYYFMATFISEHIKFHAHHLRA